MFDAPAALAAVQAEGIPCIGFDLPDQANPAGWRLFGVSTADRPRAVQILQDRMMPAPVPSSTFWPSSLDELRADLARVKTFTGAP